MIYILSKGIWWWGSGWGGGGGGGGVWGFKLFYLYVYTPL